MDGEGGTREWEGGRGSEVAEEGGRRWEGVSKKG